MRDEHQRFVDGDLERDPSLNTTPVEPDEELRRATSGMAGSERQLADIHAEAQVLSMLLWAGAYSPAAATPLMIRDLVTDEHFAVANHRPVFKTISSLFDAGRPPEPVVVNSEMIRSGIAFSGCLKYLELLVAKATAVTEGKLREHAASVRDAWTRRQLVELARTIEKAAKTKTGPMALEAARTGLQDVTTRVGTRSTGTISLATCTANMVRELMAGPPLSFKTGIETIDELTGGFFPQELTIIGARTSVGKSVLAVAVATGIIDTQENTGALYVSLEMPARAFVRRLAAAKMGVDAKKIRRGTLSQHEFQTLLGFGAKYGAKPISFVDDQVQTCSTIESLAHAHSDNLARKGKRLGIVVIDHIGLIKVDGALASKGREQQMAAIAQWMIHFTSRIGCPVIGLAQINREAEGQKGSTMPKVHHIRESGTIEQNANNILILHRARDASGVKFMPGPATLGLAKARDDEPAVTYLGFKASHSEVYDLPPDERVVTSL